MDFSESTKMVISRIKMLDPENVSKIVGYFLLQDHGEKEMVRLAFCPDAQLLSLMNKAKAELASYPKFSISTPVTPTSIYPSTTVSNVPLQFTPLPSVVPRPLPPSISFQANAACYLDPQLLTVGRPVHTIDFVPPIVFSDSPEDAYCHHNCARFVSLENQIEPVNSVRPDFLNNYYAEAAMDPLSARASKRLPSMPEFSVKVCHYFNKGYCKHGTNCRYFHGQDFQDNFSQIYGSTTNDLVNKDHVFSPLALEKLELELTELLKSMKGMPVSIASLPTMYYDMYGKNLQAEGYITESQRHGKTGFSLTKLLARLKNTICLIDRPHGQHFLILAEDAPKYMEYRGERNDPGVAVAGSRQIYLTFPAESTFTEDDVSNYFKNFGPVQDVRIPCQQKRMFGFVTFLYPETVKLILQKGNPHFVCGSRVLVKPYKEKSRLVDRKYTEKIDSPVYYPSHFVDMDMELHSTPRVCDNSRLLRKQLIEEHEHMLELERRCLSKLQLAPRQLARQANLSFSIGESKAVEDHNEFNYLLDVQNNGSTSDDVRHVSSNGNDQDSGQGITLPDSPFASAVSNSISTVI